MTYAIGGRAETRRAPGMVNVVAAAVDMPCQERSIDAARCRNRPPALAAAPKNPRAARRPPREGFSKKGHGDAREENKSAIRVK